MNSIQEALNELNIDKEEFDRIISDEGSRRKIVECLLHCFENIEELRSVSSVLLQYISSIRLDGCPGPANFDDETEWITVNGTHVPLDEEGNPTGKIAEKIKESSEHASGSKSSVKNTIPPKIENPVRPKKADFSNDEEYQKARAEYRAKRDEYDSEIHKRVNAASDRPRKYDTHEKGMSRFKEMGMDTSDADTSNIDPKIYDDISETYEEMFDRFPEVKKYEDQYTPFELSTYNGKGICDYAFAANHGLELGRIWNDYEVGIEDDLGSKMSGYTTYGDGTIKTTMRHEFGHLVDNYIRSTLRLREFDPSKETIEEYKKYRISQSEHNRKYVQELMGLTKKHCKTEYAFTNDNEAFAEGFAEYTSNPDSDYGKAFGEFFKRWYKK